MGLWEKSLDDLMAGNERFVSGDLKAGRRDEELRENLFRHGQHPIAAVVCTSDAYVPPDILFDAELGDLYVIRIPELEVDRTVLAGLEFAINKLRVPLCMIIGHEDRPGDPDDDEEPFFFFKKQEEGIEEIIKTAVNKVRNDSDFEDALERGDLLVVGAKYDLESGAVTVFDF